LFKGVKWIENILLLVCKRSFDLQQKQVLMQETEVATARRTKRKMGKVDSRQTTQHSKATIARKRNCQKFKGLIET
jgi:hypothetical protein